MKCTERWKIMTEDEKKRFYHMAECELNNVIKESSNDISPSAKSETNKANEKEIPKSPKGRKRKQMKDPGAPKRNMGSFMWFSLEERPKIKAEMPEIGHLDIFKELGKRWTQCPMESKNKFKEMAANDRMRYESEKTIYSRKSQSDDGKKDSSVDIRDD